MSEMTGRRAFIKAWLVLLSGKGTVKGSDASDEVGRQLAVARIQAKQAGKPSAAIPKLSWDDNSLIVSHPGIPGGRIEINYLEAYCRSNSTHRTWEKTIIPHQTKKLHETGDGSFIELLSAVEGGVEVRHEIRAGEDEVGFRVRAFNRSPVYADVVWAQPCIRVGTFTGRNEEDYISRSFIFVNGRLTTLDKTHRTLDALYKGGQVYVPAGISLRDVNPRPISTDGPSNGLIGCFSADGRTILATAWEPYQELFQGVLVCLHSDFRLGGLEPGQTKTARGKLYIVENDIPELLRRYQRDFGHSSATIRFRAGPGLEPQAQLPFQSADGGAPALKKLPGERR